MKKNKHEPAIEAPSAAELCEKAKGMIDRAFDFFRDHFGTLSKELADIDSGHRHAKEKISRGARRTNGRIV